MVMFGRKKDKLYAYAREKASSRARLALAVVARAPKLISSKIIINSSPLVLKSEPIMRFNIIPFRFIAEIYNVRLVIFVYSFVISRTTKWRASGVYSGNDEKRFRINFLSST